ncbi:MAG: hypothetical protein Q8N18_03505 [Opitutaceae bacterium]|nr:hypothetical protein [Opitutaceae bacterium]
MSLINEALKKAQRARHDGADDTLAAIGVDAPATALRRPAEKSNTALLIGAGALLIVVLSVVATVYLVNRPGTPTATPTVAAGPKPASAPAPASVATAAKPAAMPDPAPEIITPAPKPATVSVPPTVLVESKPSVAPSPEKSAKPTATPSPPAPPEKVAAAATPAFVAPVITAALPPPKPDERIAEFVESIRLTSIRGAGTDGRVLMNNRVYRVNDIVDRALNVKLTTIATDTLTFTDGNGFTYVRNF